MALLYVRAMRVRLSYLLSALIKEASVASNAGWILGLPMNYLTANGCPWLNCNKMYFITSEPYIITGYIITGASCLAMYSLVS